jgi:predicted  nucleic acid-binding Zn-ribbon protein
MTDATQQLRAALARLDAEAHRQAQQWAMLAEQMRRAIVATTDAGRRDALQQAADLEYELCGGCDVIGPILDTLLPSEE